MCAPLLRGRVKRESENFECFPSGTEHQSRPDVGSRLPVILKFCPTFQQENHGAFAFGFRLFFITGSNLSRFPVPEFPKGMTKFLRSQGLS